MKPGTVPHVMAYADLAGLPVAGLWAILARPVLNVLLGSSRRMSMARRRQASPGGSVVTRTPLTSWTALPCHSYVSV